MSGVLVRLLRTLLDNRSATSAVSRLRTRRWEVFVTLCAPDPSRPLLDVGGTADDSFARRWPNPTVRVNLFPSRPQRPGDRHVVADARRLPFRDRSFPVLFSNSLLEHLATPEDQRQAAREMARVADRFFVETPNKHFPLEPHYLIPFFQFLPRPAQRLLHRVVPWGWVPVGRFEDIRLLTAHELQELFPGAQILRERVWGMSKSLFAVRGAGAAG